MRGVSGADVAPGLLQKSAGDISNNQKSDGLLRRQDAAQRKHTIKYQLVWSEKKIIILMIIIITII